MPSYLGLFHGAAFDRRNKFRRAVNSCLAQSFEDFELMIIADGCEDTFRIICDEYSDDRIKCLMIGKQKLWSGLVRNAGIKNAEGDFIVYCDTDDIIGQDHLKIIHENISTYDWVYFNDHRFKDGQFVERGCDINQRGQNGTSNVAHKKSLNVFWTDSTYAHDWHFIQTLKRSSANFIKIPAAQYYTCHIPHYYDI